MGRGFLVSERCRSGRRNPGLLLCSFDSPTCFVLGSLETLCDYQGRDKE